MEMEEKKGREENIWDIKLEMKMKNYNRYFKKYY